MKLIRIWHVFRSVSKGEYMEVKTFLARSRGITPDGEQFVIQVQTRSWMKVSTRSAWPNEGLLADITAYSLV